MIDRSRRIQCLNIYLLLKIESYSNILYIFITFYCCRHSDVSSEEKWHRNSLKSFRFLTSVFMQLISTFYIVKDWSYHPGSGFLMNRITLNKWANWSMTGWYFQDSVFVAVSSLAEAIISGESRSISLPYDYFFLFFCLTIPGYLEFAIPSRKSQCIFF